MIASKNKKNGMNRFLMREITLFSKMKKLECVIEFITGKSLIFTFITTRSYQQISNHEFSSR